MTALAPLRPTGSVLRVSTGRLLRLELRRNAMVWLVPLVVGMFWFDTFRSSLGQPPLWGERLSFLEQGRALVDLAPFVAGTAAWMASRDGRRGIDDQVTATPLPRWAAQLSAWAATTCWALVAYAICIGLLFGAIAADGSGGSPIWWPVLMGAVGVAAFSALGFAAGALFQSRFTVPLAGIGALLLLVMGQYKITHSLSYGLVSPTNNYGQPGLNTGVFYPFLPDLSIVQTSFLAGLAIAALGAPGVAAANGHRVIRGTAIAVTVVGVAMAGTGVGLAGTAAIEARGVVIPALHDAADDRPVPYTPVCAGDDVPVCVHPAYQNELPALVSAVEPLLVEVKGLPGAPTKVAQTAFFDPATKQTTGPALGGSPVVLTVPFEGMLGWNTPEDLAGDVRQTVGNLVVDNVVGGGTDAQQAVGAGLLLANGMSPTGPARSTGSRRSRGGGPAAGGLEPGSPAYAAAQRFAALSSGARHTWLVEHLTALRAGTITLERLP